MPKDSKQVYHFINLLFALVVILSAWFFFKQGDRLENFSRFLGLLAPFALIAGGYLLFKKFKKPEFRGQEEAREMEFKLYLTHLDKLKGDMIMFSLPLVVLVIAVFIQNKLYFVDLVQALAVFLIFYLWQKWLYRHR